MGFVSTGVTEQSIRDVERGCSDTLHGLLKPGKEKSYGEVDDK